jgi:hypothetical protein
MSTRFGIPMREVDIQLGDENGIFDYISEDFFEFVAMRDDNGKFRFYHGYRKKLDDNTKVYALDNSQQGIYTIRDILEEMKSKQKP